VQPAVPRILCVLMGITVSNVTDRGMFVINIIMHFNALMAHIALLFLAIRSDYNDAE
jgi:hypothetical protein